MRTKCQSCCFVRHDPSASDGSFPAFECSNPKSEFYRALLNVTKNGDLEAAIQWIGCDQWKKAQRKVERKELVKV